MNRSEIKSNAKNSLQGKYGETIKLILAYYGIVIVVALILSALGEGDTVELLTGVISVVISALLYFGYKSFFLKISRGEDAKFNELFKRTDLFLMYIGLSFLTSLFISLWSLLFIIPGIIAFFSYQMIYYIALDNPNMGIMEIIKKSKTMMKGYKWQYFVLVLSFIGWEILSLFTLGILNLWLMPYMEVTFANFYNKIRI